MPIGTPPGRWPAPRIARGDLQATFTFKGFDDVRRLGLRAATEAAVRACGSGAPPTVTACGMHTLLVCFHLFNKRSTVLRTDGG